MATTTQAPRDILFLPGAAGSGTFWRPLGKLLPTRYGQTHLSWPGLGHEAHAPGLASFSDLAGLAERALRGPTAIIAQSMGGVVGLLLALRRPDLISRLVLVATAGGLDLAAFGAEDWRPGYRAAFPSAAGWVMTEKTDLTGELRRLAMPTLLLWGGEDTVSPPAVGRFLAGMIPDARLVVIPEGRHAMGGEMPEALAGPIIEHLAS